jgi:hypothetical protein
MDRIRWGILGIGFGILAGMAGAGAAVPEESRQLVVVLAKDWESQKALLWTFERAPDGEWMAAWDTPVPVLLGKGGLAWGRGLAPAVPGSDRVKVEGDRRTPAGVFRIGKIYGDPKALPGGNRYPYHQVGPWDAWVDDVKNPHYNRHYVATPGKVPPWFESQRMRRGDPAYEYLVEIRHNADPPVPGFGSAIFFHIRRGEDRPSHGCTVMAKSDLLRVIAWLRADARPVYAVLPKSEYDRLREAWRLPVFR